MFEDDERFSAVERTRDREDLFETYLLELQKKVSIKALCLLVHILTMYYSFLVLFKPHVSWLIHMKPVQMHFKTTKAILEYVAVQVFLQNAWDLPLLKLGALNKIEPSWLGFTFFFNLRINGALDYISPTKYSLGLSLLEVFHIYIYIYTC